MKIAGYTETPYVDSMTAEDMIRREECRLAPYRPANDLGLAAAFGDNWRRYKPFPEFIVWHRYLRRRADGAPYESTEKYREADSGWAPWGIYGTRRMAIFDLPDGLTPADSADGRALGLLQAERRRAAEEKAEAEHEAAELEREKHRLLEERRAARECWKKLAKSHPDVCERWNGLAEVMQADSDLYGHGAADEAFRQLARAAETEPKIPQRRKAIRLACEYAEKHFGFTDR